MKIQKSSKTWLILGGIILLGIFLRINALGTESLWIDEAVSLLEAQKIVPDLITQVIELDGSPYGHHLLLHYWIKWFGNSEFSVRLPSTIFSILAI